MSTRLKIVIYLGISLYLLLMQCQVSADQNLYQLSYGNENVAGPISTPTPPPTTTTKKSSFFKGIKNWFRGESTSTTSSPITPAPTSGIINANSGNIPIPLQPSPSQPIPPGSSTPKTPVSNRDFVNTNIKPGSGPTNLPSGSSSPFNQPQPPQYSTPTSPSSSRDFVNTNIKPGSAPTNLPSGSSSPFNQPQPPQYSTPTSPSSSRDFVNTNIRPESPPINLPSQPSNPQTPGTNRDYVNLNIRPGNVPNSTPGNVPVTPSGPPTSTGRDFVNPNIRPGNLPTNIPQGTPPSPTAPSNFNSRQQPSGNRDYINPNIQPGKPQILPTPAPSLPLTPTSPMQGQRDYFNPAIGTPSRPQSINSVSGRDDVNTVSSPTIPSTPKSPQSGPQLTKEDFPPLPPPRRPRPGTSTQRPPTGSSSRTNDLATDEEITALTETLFSKDVNNQNKHVTINYQGRTRSSDTTDEAPNPLLQVNDQALQSPTIEKMIPLFNNYELDTTVNEYVTPIERKEENDFVDALMTTQVMRQAMLFLQNKGIVTPDPKTHRELLKTIWFTLYSRGGGRIGSSAFEHIFLTEIKNGTVTGLHNWVYYYEEERRGHIDYKGYIKKLELGDKGAIIKYRFDFNGFNKPVNAMFVGTSPELEIALYTVCFQLRPDKDCPISLNGNKFNIQTYTFRYRGKNLIGSAFPEI